MQKLLRIFWVVILLLSALWAVGGAVLSLGVADELAAADSLREGATAFSDGVNAAVPLELPQALIFLITGLPIALISLYLARRNHRALAQAAGKEKTGAQVQRGTIAITGLSLVVALLLWNGGRVDALLGQPGGLNLTAITYPVRLFVTFIHEAGHALAAVLSGGQIVGFTVSPDGSGLATTAGGNASLILPAGYLGAALFGALLYLVSSRAPDAARLVSSALGVAFVALSLLYARPDAAGNMTALLVGLGYGAALILLGWFAPRVVNVFLLNTLAILTGLHAVFDLINVTLNSGVGSEQALNDAARFSQDIAPLLPPWLVALLWAGIAVGMMAAAMYFGLIKPLRSQLT